MSEKVCPCCGCHCPLSNPSCDKGKMYAQSDLSDTAKDSVNGDDEMNRRHRLRHSHHGEYRRRR